MLSNKEYDSILNMMLKSKRALSPKFFMLAIDAVSLQAELSLQT